jgi:hypothetical protein
VQGILSYQIRTVDIGDTPVPTGIEEVVTPTDSPTLEHLQSAVDGLIETMTRLTSPFRKGITIDAYVNEEGLNIGLPIVMAVSDKYGVRPFAGNIVFVGSNDDGESVPLTDQEIDFIRDRQRGTTFLLSE